jgi:myotubularin-related protein 5/13
MKTARKAGFKQKSSSKRHKYVLPNISNNSINKGNKYLTTPGRMSLPPFNNLDDISGKLNSYHDKIVIKLLF